MLYNYINNTFTYNKYNIRILLIIIIENTLELYDFNKKKCPDDFI